MWHSVKCTQSGVPSGTMYSQSSTRHLLSLNTVRDNNLRIAISAPVPFTPWSSTVSHNLIQMCFLLQWVKERGVSCRWRENIWSICTENVFSHTYSSFELQRTSSVRFFRDSKWDARNLHCLTSSNGCTSKAAIVLNVCDLRVDSWSLQILRRYEILLHTIRTNMHCWPV